VTLVEGDHGTFEWSAQDHCDESLVEDFASLNLSNANVSDSSCNISKCNFSFNTGDFHDSKLNNGCETSINDSNISTYYSFCDESIHQGTCDNQACPSSGNSDVMFTSTPVKVDKSSTNNPCEISCSQCSTAHVSYYITAATTKVIINQSHDDKDTTHDVIKEKLTYDSVGGLDKQIQTLKEMLEFSIKSPNLFQSYGEYRKRDESAEQCSAEQCSIIVQFCTVSYSNICVILTNCNAEQQVYSGSVPCNTIVYAISTL
jgi:hypothetical protein